MRPNFQGGAYLRRKGYSPSHKLSLVDLAYSIVIGVGLLGWGAFVVVAMIASLFG